MKTFLLISLTPGHKLVGLCGFNRDHFGYDLQRAERALSPPLHLTSTFAFETAEQGGDIFAGERDGHFYARISNPTTHLLETCIATLENAEAAVARKFAQLGTIPMSAFKIKLNRS